MGPWTWGRGRGLGVGLGCRGRGCLGLGRGGRGSEFFVTSGLILRRGQCRLFWRRPASDSNYNVAVFGDMVLAAALSSVVVGLACIVLLPLDPAWAAGLDCVECSTCWSRLTSLRSLLAPAAAYFFLGALFLGP